MKASIVVDLGFGDSGKGITVDYLASKNPAASLVVRFGGGHQVGHSVHIGERSHVFSNFGSASMRGVPTWFGPLCVVFPPAIVLEAQALAAYGPQLFIHPLAMVASPWDIAWNRAREAVLGHGSCGVGFGATVERNASGIRLYAKDILFPWVFREKLQAIASWYRELAGRSGDHQFLHVWNDEAGSIDAGRFEEMCRSAASIFELAPLAPLAAKAGHLIFEGHQGIMLDQDNGIYPHLTWSSTGSKGALELLASDTHFELEGIDIYYVTRCYQTRHGTGPMSHGDPVCLINTEAESNIENKFQGRLRTSTLDTELLEYALLSDQCDLAQIWGRRLPLPRYHLVITCLDQLPGFDLQAMLSGFGRRFDAVYGSYSPDSAGIRELSGV